MRTTRFLLLGIGLLATAAFAGTYRPGLNQGKSNANNAWSFSLASSVIPVERVPGPVMGDIFAEENSHADVAHSYLNAATGTRYYWNKENTTFAYVGDIYLEAGVTYVFGKRLDDGARIVIGETVVLENTSWNAFATGSFTPTETGWYPVDIRVADGNGGKGPQDDGIHDSGLGLAYNTQGSTSEGNASWSPLRDPGDLSLFRVLTDENMSFIQCVSIADGVYTFTLSVPGGSGTASVYLNSTAVSASTPADLAAMDASSAQVSIPANGTATATVAWDGASAPYVVIHASGIDAGGGFEAYTDPVVFDSTSITPPVVNIPVVDAGFLVSTIVYCGPESSSADVTFAYGPVGQTLPAPSATRTGLVAGDTISFLMSDLDWDTEYAYEIIVDGDGDAPASFTGSFRSPAEDFGGRPGLRQGRYKTSESDPDPHTDTRIADLDPSAVDNTLGMLMARASSDNVKTATCTDSATSSGWGWDEDYLCFVYEGYIWLEADVPFYVISKFDDGGAVYIDDTMVFDQWTINGDGSGYNDRGNYAAGVFVPTRTGWHDFRGYIWDWAGGKEHMWGVAGVQWTTDPAAVTVSGGKTVAISDRVSSTAYWNEFYDDGNGNFLTIVPPALELGSSAMEGDTLVSLVSIPAIGPCTLYAWYGAAYGGADSNAWTGTSASLGTFNGNGTEAPFVRMDLAAGVNYVRYFAVPESGALPSLSPTVCRSQISGFSNTPNVSVGTPELRGIDTVAIPLRVLSPGADAATCDAYIVHGLAAGALLHTNLVASGLSAGASTTLVLEGLQPNRQHFLAVLCVSDQGGEFLSPVTSLRTGLLVDEGVISADSQPGLWQAFADFYQDRSDPAATADAEVVPGAIMAAAGNNAEYSPFTSYTAPSGHTFTYQVNSTYSYSGYMKMEGGLTYTFGADFDDWTFLSVDGRTLIDDEGYNSKIFASFTPPATGWYPIVVRVGDKGGNVGATDGPFATAYLGSAFGFSTNETTLTTGNYNHWRPLTNTVDSVVFRTSPFLRSVTPGEPVVVDGTLIVPLTLGSDGEARDLYVCYGPSYGGTNVAAWAHVENLGTIAADTASYTSDGDVTGVYDSVHYVRYFFDCGSEGKNWSATLQFFDASAPALGPATAVSGLDRGDGVIVSGSLDSTGGSVCTVTLEVARDADFVDVFAWPVATLSAPGDLSVDVYTNDTESVAYIEPGVRYYYRFKAVNESGSFDLTPASSFVTKAGVALGGITASNAQWDITVTGSLADFGAGDTTTVWLYAGTSSDALAPVDTEVLSSGATGFTLSAEAPSFGEPFYYAVLASNACSTAWWTDRSETQSITCTDSADYYWKGSVLNGAWNDPDCWDTVPDDPRLTYPNSKDARVYFSQCISGASYTIAVPAAYDIRYFTANVAGSDLTFVGQGRSVSKINIPIFNEAGFSLAENSVVTFDGLTVWEDHFNPPKNCTIRLINGAALQVGRELQGFGENSVLEAHGDSLIEIQSYALRFGGKNTRIVLDDSTLQVNKETANLAYGNNATNNVIEFYGAHPKLIARGIRAAVDAGDGSSTGVPKLVFHVPAEGYAEAPIQRNAENKLLLDNDKQDLRIEIARDSDWFQGSKTADIPLIAWGPGIRVSRIDLAGQPRPQATTLYWTYGSNLTDSTATTSDGNDPTGLWAKLVGSGTTVIFLR